MRVICDTNIIIDLAKIHNLDLLKNFFNEVLIPDEVKEELLAGERSGPEDDDIIKAIDEWIMVKKVNDLLNDYILSSRLL